MKASELILRSDGSLYHLHLKPGDLASRIIFVGDPDRVTAISKHFSEIHIERRNREFYTLTGAFRGLPLSIISTGIGTDNIDIVWNEIDALFNIDLNTRKLKSSLTPLKVLRLGTCGGMQENVEVGSLVNSVYAIGGDGLMTFYEQRESEEMKDTFSSHLAESEYTTFPFYTSTGSESFSRLLQKHFPHILQGITFTAAGFYGPQGRSLGRIPIKYPDLPLRLSEFSYKAYKILNMEMETAAILGLGKALGHEAASLSTILANRQRGTFSQNPGQAVEKLIRTGLEALSMW